MLVSCSSRQQIFTCKYWDEATAELMKLKQNKSPYLQTFTKRITIFITKRLKIKDLIIWTLPLSYTEEICSLFSVQVCNSTEQNRTPPRPGHRGVSTHQNTPTSSLWLAHPLLRPLTALFSESDQSAHITNVNRLFRLQNKSLKFFF